MDNIIHHKFTLNNWYNLECPVLSGSCQTFVLSFEASHHISSTSLTAALVISRIISFVILSSVMFCSFFRHCRNLHMLGLLQDIITLKLWCQPSTMLELRSRRRAVASFWFQREWERADQRVRYQPKSSSNNR